MWILFRGNRRYVPPGSAGSAPAAGASANAGYFSGLRAKNARDADKGTADMPTRAEMSATVKAAARAAAARLAGDKNTSAATNGGSSSSGTGAAAGGGKRIERDIFAARPSRGQALGVSAGGYDVYPETGDFETYDSDEVKVLVLFYPCMWMQYSLIREGMKCCRLYCGCRRQDGSMTVMVSPFTVLSTS